MMEGLFNAIRAQGALQNGQVGQARCGIVQSFDPATYCAKVTLQPENVLTGWLPITSAWVGAGWGLAAPPSPGQQVLVLAQEGQAEHGVIVGGLFSTAATPPAAPSGELWLVHQAGAFLKLHNDGTVEGNATRWTITGAVDVTGPVTITGSVTITGAVEITGEVEVTGNILASGEISDEGQSHGTLGQLRIIYDEHTHSNVQAGPDRTGLPTPQA
jgi:phage baseplate assembly protein V